MPDIYSPDTLLLKNQSHIELQKPGLRLPAQYWDPRNAIPRNSMELDYRHGSYYTPMEVSDKITHIMNRPPADSFVPLPAVAFIAASMALRYLDIEKKIEIDAMDYLLPERMYPILMALWDKSPQTIDELYESAQINKERSMVNLQNDVDALVEKKLLKIKKMQLAPSQYFASQTLVQARALIEQSIEKTIPESAKRQELVNLFKKLNITE